MNKSKLYIFLVLLLFVTGAGLNLFSQEKKTDLQKDRDIFTDYLRSTDKTTGSNELMVRTALYFLKIPYVSNTLDIHNTEKLIINLREMDCTTLVENCLALTRTLHSATPDFETFKKELQRIRYRDGIIKDYTSRLHYTSDWIVNNEKKGILLDITQEAGGVEFPVHVSYMSRHPQYYSSLKKNPGQVREIKEIETAINNRKGVYYYIPKDKIRENESKIRSGDILCFTTSIDGLDISHMGIAYRKDGRLTFIHASSTKKEVIINPEPVDVYCKNIKTNTGIMVLRVN